MVGLSWRVRAVRVWRPVLRSSAAIWPPERPPAWGVGVSEVCWRERGGD